MTTESVDDPVVAIIGPTAAGKSDLALELARRIPRATGVAAEVVNADSMQVYRGMDIGTAKPTVAERAEIRHHLIDILDVTEPATVAEFQLLARRAIADCHGRGVLPLLVGGSALYIRAVLDRFEFPGTDPQIRARLERELDDVGPAALHTRLSTVDPEAAAGILPGNGRRIVRALEVIELTGGPFTASLPGTSEAVSHYPAAARIGLELPRDLLDQRIADRVERMWRAGLVGEVRRLSEVGLRSGSTASRALGYAQVLRHLDGETTEDEARAETIRATRRFARRQDQWFGKDPRVTWVPAPGRPEAVERALVIAAGLIEDRREEIH